jgi:uncharacterized protein YlxW (UPF0749 family)
MADRGRRAMRRRGLGSVSVALVLILAGVLFTTSARLAGGVDARQPQDLPQLLAVEQTRLAELEEEAADLQSEIDRFTDSQTDVSDKGDQVESELVALLAGRRDVTGPGLIVSLSDAPANSPRPGWITDDDLVVHQQDLQGVINALWAGGAEAMTLQDQRVISTSAFRCVGNVLSLHGRLYSPPYVVRAIGDPELLERALLASPEVQTYLGYVEVIGLGWSVSSSDRLELPAYSRTLELRHAAVPDGVDPLAFGRLP